MAIEGLKVSTEIPAEVSNITDNVGAAVEALQRLGQVEDQERVHETVYIDFKALDASGRTGYKFVHLAPGRVTLQEFKVVLDGEAFPQGSYPETYIDDEIWTPSIARAKTVNSPTHARLAVYANNPNDPLLHFLNQPYDEKYASKGKETQLQAIAKAKAAYEAEHDDCNMQPLNHQDFAFIALMKRILGEEMPVSWGFMRDATLPRVTADGDSWVGYVYSYDGQLRFRGSNGYAYPYGGVGLSVGQNLEPQAS